MIYQRLRLHNKNEDATQWYRLQWVEEPSAALLLPQEAYQPVTAPTLTLSNPQAPDFARRLYDELTTAGLTADACFACRHWQPQTSHSVDGLPTGKCQWRAEMEIDAAAIDAKAEIPDALETQSALSLACTHFDRANTPPASPKRDATLPTSQPRIQKSAELDPDRLAFWPRLWHRIRHHFGQGTQSNSAWADQIVERSGVGAGTEPCFACQGRLANLGAIAVASDEGDKQTLSVWRCRNCYTLYLNDWTDRWERLDNLETEELYYRLAPAEAYVVLAIIHETIGGEHPGGRQDRHPQRAQLLALVAKKSPLSHQVRQGR